MRIAQEQTPSKTADLLVLANPKEEHKLERSLEQTEPAEKQNVGDLESKYYEIFLAEE